MIHPAQKHQNFHSSNSAKFWGYLEEYPLTLRYDVAASIIANKDIATVIELGAYRSNIVSNYVDVQTYAFSIDVEELISYNDRCVTIKDDISNYKQYIDSADCFVAIGYELIGNQDIVIELASNSNLAIIEGWDDADKHSSFNTIINMLCNELNHKHYTVEFDFSFLDELFVEKSHTFISDSRGFLSSMPWRKRKMYVFEAA